MCHAAAAETTAMGGKRMGGMGRMGAMAAGRQPAVKVLIGVGEGWKTENVRFGVNSQFGALAKTVGQLLSECVVAKGFWPALGLHGGLPARNWLIKTQLWGHGQWKSNWRLIRMGIWSLEPYDTLPRVSLITQGFNKYLMFLAEL